MQSQMNLFGRSSRPFLFLIDFLCENFVLIPLEETDPKFILFQIGDITNHDILEYDKSKEVVFTPNPISFANYAQQFAQVMQHILAGNTYLLNLTCATPIATNLNLFEIYARSRATYHVWVKDAFTVFSPEPFVKMKGGRVYSFPMKGTIDASLADARALILNDEKELAEHYTIVDLIRNDLSIVSQGVKVDEFRYLQEIKTSGKPLLQVSSRISGDLPSGYNDHLGDIFFQLLPAGSISGAPKEKTVEIIQAVERYKRGFYTGICGVFNGKDLDSGVMIRFVEQLDQGFVFKSGGGITYRSDASSEYQEMIDKVYLPIL